MPRQTQDLGNDTVWVKVESSHRLEGGHRHSERLWKTTAPHEKVEQKTSLDLPGLAELSLGAHFSARCCRTEGNKLKRFCLHSQGLLGTVPW